MSADQRISHATPVGHPEHSPARWGTSLGVGEIISVDELLKIPIFEGASKGLLEKNTGAVVRRRFKAGEIICREGEFGSTAFYILEGTAEVSISTPIAHVKTDHSSGGFFTRLKSKLVGHTQDPREEEAERRWIPIDAPVDLAYEHPVAELKAGDLFGEMTCMNFYPRSATVLAVNDCVLLEMLRNILDILLKNQKFKARANQSYRERSLETHLRSVPLIASLGSRATEVACYLRDRVELMRLEPGEIIFKQGDIADSFFLVRIGFVKVSEIHPGGELVLAYLPRGSYFGEIGLLGEGVRTATCTAIDHVDLVKVRAEDFRFIVEQNPNVLEQLQAVANERTEQNRKALETRASVPLESFLEQGLFEANSLLLLDLDRCTRCDLCVRACADSHDGITRLIREGLRFENFLVATSCRQCRDPLCMVGCPVGSIRRRTTLEVIIEDWCIGCGLCAKNCPYGNINMHPIEMIQNATSEVASEPPIEVRKKAARKMKAATCDLCLGLDEPSCTYACPHDAAHRVDPAKFLLQVQKSLQEHGRER